MRYKQIIEIKKNVHLRYDSRRDTSKKDSNRRIQMYISNTQVYFTKLLETFPFPSFMIESFDRNPYPKSLSTAELCDGLGTFTDSMFG